MPALVDNKMSQNRNKKLMKSICEFVCVSYVIVQNSLCFGLGVLPASQNPMVKRKIVAALKRTNIRYAESDDAKRLLAAYNTSCLLLSSGNYLVTKEVADDNLKLLRAITHEDIEALMQIISVKDSYKYQAIKELVMKRFPPTEENIARYFPLNTDEGFSINLYANHIIASAFEWLVLVKNGIIFEDEIPDSQKDFIDKIRPRIETNKHNYFTGEFWDDSFRGERIRKAIESGMTFYQTAGRELPAEDNKAKLTALATAFWEKRKSEGIEFHDAYIEIIVGVFLRLEVDPDDIDRGPDEVFVEALKKNNIKRILEIGCGDCAFLAAIADIAEKAGCQLTGTDIEPLPADERVEAILESKHVSVFETGSREFEDDERFDLIISSGSISLLEAYPGGTDVMDREGLLAALKYAQGTAEEVISLLSDHPKASFIANALTTILMLYRHKLEEFAEVVLWDDDINGDMFDAHRLVVGSYGQELLVKIWGQAGSFMILTRKTDEDQAMRNDNGGQTVFKAIDMDKIQYDAEETARLNFDILHSAFEKGRTYRIKYDESRLSESQIAILREYANIMRDKYSVDIHINPFSSERGSEESLIAVYSSGEGFTGEGHVDVNIPDGDIENYLLRVTGMLSIAMAASNIPDNVSEAELKTQYSPIVSFIQNQYKSILGTDLTLSGSITEIVKALQHIVLDLPKVHRKPIESIREYDRLARQALISA